MEVGRGTLEIDTGDFAHLDHEWFVGRPLDVRWPPDTSTATTARTSSNVIRFGSPKQLSVRAVVGEVPADLKLMLEVRRCWVLRRGWARLRSPNLNH